MTSQRSPASSQSGPSAMAQLASGSPIPRILVALTVFRASAWACLLCFTDYSERARICQAFVGMDDEEVKKCDTEFWEAFKNLSNVDFNYDERGNLHDSFTQMILSLQEVDPTKVPLKVALRAAAVKMWEAIKKLKEEPACVPPCGVQEASRRFHCDLCFSTTCDYPLDCPVKDVVVKRGREAKFLCSVAFQLPEEMITYSWKFAGGGVRTRDMSYFRDMPQAHASLARIRPVQPTHSGTFCCTISHDQLPVARLFFFLKVTGPPPRGDTELQLALQEVLRWSQPDGVTVEPWRPSLGELLARPGALSLGNQYLLSAVAALASASVTLLVWAFFRWYLRGN